MKNFKISTQVVWFLVIGGICITGFGFYADSQDWFLSQQLRSIGGTLFFTSWIVVMVELFTHSVYNQIFWILSMLIFPPLAIIFYLIHREKLLRLGEKQ